MTDPPFTRIAVVGLGLIGGSIALAAQRVWPGMALVGLDHDAATAEAARRTIVHEVVDSVAELDGCDLVILAVPPAPMMDLMPALVGLTGPPVVTDVGSTKRQVMAGAAAAGLPSFVGGHPMGGSERVGLDHARGDLFEGRPWLLVKGTGDAAACAGVERFVAGLGAMPQWIDADAHDRAVAYVSHLPQLVAVSLMNAASDELGPGGLSAAGRAFAEMTRLASSPPDLWDSIFSRNADFVAEAMARFVASLPSGADLADGQWVRDAFGRAAAARLRARGQDAADEKR